MAAVVLIAACDGTSPGPTSTSDRVGPPTTARPVDVTGTIGTGLPFAGLTLTVTGPVTDPGDPAAAVVQPDPGTRYVRVGIHVVNPTTQGLSFTPVTQAVLIDDAGTRVPVTPGLYPDDLAGVDVPARQEVSGQISFVVPDGRRAVALLLTDLQGITTTVELR